VRISCFRDVGEGNGAKEEIDTKKTARPVDSMLCGCGGKRALSEL